MKKIKVLACLLAALLLVLPFASCKSTPKVSVNCTVSVVGLDDDPIILDKSVTVTKDEGQTITLLDAIRQALDEMEIKYDVDEDDDGKPLGFNSITNTEGTEYKVGYTDASKEYYGFWICTVDGVEPDKRASIAPATEGAKIVYTYIVESQADLEAAAG